VTKNYMVIALLMLVSPWASSDIVVGTTYDIVENDPIETLEKKAKAYLSNRSKTPTQNNWLITIQPDYLPRSLQPETRIFEPVYEVEHVVADKNGNILYPKGYLYNPLEHMDIPFRIIVVDESDADWLKKQLQDGDVILLNRGTHGSLSKKLEHRVYIADKNTIARLNVQSVPSIVIEKDDRFVITEVPNES